ncbi:RimJ/RimL family protein N-acetyltransferase [Agromyces flavus]|uniref:Protein N-acetyltransferase, RimJ/RimL family n=1 Tax=Agromyces flavus TaxID=589382 RepID=A0A1H1XB47_9MICO|nr:GNAT family protein [Agromyces flavus]MCP2366375.1 RimJ/RimL family protein N-acetyltransferase [Agromyces flavus]GGI44550.1 succinyl-CoA transferase Rv0802c [Agromyces flavus]SDT06548.1 Protein N-acetyltransferase, RimJ/RimL family [Agromyces flavus]
MDLEDVWPLFRLRLRTPRLELRLARDEDLGPLVDAALAGIHDPSVMPFAAPWTDAEPDVQRRGLAQHVWRQRAALERDEWTLLFAVLHDGVPVGLQDVRGHRFPARRTISTGSWLTASKQGLGLGKEMRAAVLIWAFDHLGAEVAETSAADWNGASLGVTKSLGYRENGVSRLETRPGEVSIDVRFRLEPGWLVRPDWTLEVDGAGAARDELGLE